MRYDIAIRVGDTRKAVPEVRDGSSLLQANPAWPAYLRDFHTITVTMGITVLKPVPEPLSDEVSLTICPITHHLLYSLVESLGESYNLRDLRLAMHFGDLVVNSEMIPRVFWPLAKLSVPPSHIFISGLSESAIRNAVTEARKPQAQYSGLLAQAISLISRLDGYRRLHLKLLPPSVYGRHQEALDLRIYIEGPLGGQVYMDEVQEGNLDRRLHEAVEWLEGDAGVEFEGLLRANFERRNVTKLQVMGG